MYWVLIFSFRFGASLLQTFTHSLTPWVRYTELFASAALLNSFCCNFSNEKLFIKCTYVVLLSTKNVRPCCWLLKEISWGRNWRFVIYWLKHDSLFSKFSSIINFQHCCCCRFKLFILMSPSCFKVNVYYINVILYYDLLYYLLL